MIRGWMAALCAVVLVGAGAVLVTPAAQALSGVNWGSVWKHKLQPRADKRYFTKKQATKKFAAKPKVVRGTFALIDSAANPGQEFALDISFGVTLSAAPTVHYIPAGGPVPAGCSGTALKPSASPGNLCLFEAFGSNYTTLHIYDPATAAGSFDVAEPYGAGLYVVSTAAGRVSAEGSWAVAPVKLVQNRVSTHTRGGTGGAN